MGPASIPLPPAYFQPCYFASSSLKVVSKVRFFNSRGFSVSLTPDYFSRFCVCSSPPSPTPLSSGNTELLMRLCVIWTPALPCLPCYFSSKGYPADWSILPCLLLAWLIPTPPKYSSLLRDLSESPFILQGC